VRRDILSFIGFFGFFFKFSLDFLDISYFLQLFFIFPHFFFDSLHFCEFSNNFPRSFRYQSGFQPPGDIPFEDLSKADTESTHNSQINHAISHATMKGTIGAKNLKKRVGIFNIFSSNKVSYVPDLSTPTHRFKLF
jgi:hypothetical protein